MTGKTVIVGCGSLLRGDDAVGLTVLEMLKEALLPEDIDVKAAGLPGVGLLDLLAGYDSAILVDAVLGGGPAGEVLEFDLEALQGCNIRPVSLHDLDLTQALELGYLLRRGEMPHKLSFVGVTVDPSSLLPGLPLSAQGQAGAARAAALIAARLAG
jgi:hydrogenase maturation protease